MLKIFLLLLAASISTAYAGETDIKNALQKKLPQLGQIQQVNKSPIPGLYEIVTEDRLFYTDKQARYLIDGGIFDLNTMRNLTEARSHQLFDVTVEFDKLPLDLAVKQVKGTGARKLAIFTDPNCGYCKKLEQALREIDNVTLYRFMYPIFPGSAEKVTGVWCSKDQVKAWDELMQNNIMPAAASCSTPTEKVLALGHQLKVNGTPALIFSDGTINPGYLPAADLEKALGAASSH